MKIIKWFLLLFVGLMAFSAIIGQFKPPQQTAAPAAAPVEKTASALPAAAQGAQPANNPPAIVEDDKEFKWRYEEQADKMGRGKIKQAIVKSKNSVDFSFPYQGEQHGLLILRDHPKFGKDVIIVVKKGQFLCRTDACKVSVQFDNGKEMVFSATEPSDNDSTYLFIKGYGKFYQAAKKSKTIKIETEFFQEGFRVFEFDSSGLAW